MDVSVKKYPRFRRIYTKISIGPDVCQRIDRVRKILHEQADEAVSYNRALRHILDRYDTVPKNSTSGNPNEQTAPGKTPNPINPISPISPGATFFVPKPLKPGRYHGKIMIDITAIPLDPIFAVISGICVLIAAVKTRDAIAAKNALGTIIDVFDPDVPDTRDQQDALDTIPEKSWKMDTMTRNEAYKILSRSAEKITWDNLMYQIDAAERFKHLNYALITSWNYANPENYGILVEYGKIKMSGTTSEIHEAAALSKSPEIMVVN